MEEKVNKSHHQDTTNCTVWICLHNYLDIPEAFKWAPTNIQKIRPTKMKVSKSFPEKVIKCKMAKF